MMVQFSNTQPKLAQWLARKCARQRPASRTPSSSSSILPMTRFRGDVPPAPHEPLSVGSEMLAVRWRMVSDDDYEPIYLREPTSVPRGDLPPRPRGAAADLAKAASRK